MSSAWLVMPTNLVAQQSGAGLVAIVSSSTTGLGQPPASNRAALKFCYDPQNVGLSSTAAEVNIATQEPIMCIAAGHTTSRQEQCKAATSWLVKLSKAKASTTTVSDAVVTCTAEPEASAMSVAACGHSARYAERALAGGWHGCGVAG